MLEDIETDTPTALSISNHSSFAGFYHTPGLFIAERGWNGGVRFKPRFRRAMEQYQPKLQDVILKALPRVMSILDTAMQMENMRQGAGEL